jgi:hypothetical protein
MARLGVAVYLYSNAKLANASSENCAGLTRAARKQTRNADRTFVSMTRDLIRHRASAPPLHAMLLGNAGDASWAAEEPQLRCERALVARIWRHERPGGM